MFFVKIEFHFIQYTGGIVILSLFFDFVFENRNMAKMVTGSQIPSSWGFYKERSEDFEPISTLHSIVANSSGLKLQDTLLFAVLTLRVFLNFHCHYNFPVSLFSPI